MVYGNECESQDSGPSAEIIIRFILSLIINLLTQRQLWAPIITIAVLFFIISNVWYVVCIEKGRGKQAGSKPMKGFYYMLNVDRLKSKS